MFSKARALLAVPAVFVAALIGAPLATATPTPTGSAPAAAQPAAKQIIMRDGGICDPIRWGC
jgi:hypothetical protein